MVHFSVRLRANMYAEWQGDYLDYKRLKKALKSSCGGGGFGRSSSKLSCAAATATSSGSDLEGEPLLARPPSSSYLATLGSSLSAADLQSLRWSPRGFLKLLEDQYAKVERAYNRHLTHLSDEFALLKQQYRPAASHAARESVLNTLVELHRLLNHLLTFALLNYKGFARIQKKHDAKLPQQPPLALQHGNRLHDFAFSDATQCSALLAQVEMLFADLFCDGNRTLAVAALMTRKEDTIDWAPVYIGIKTGSCLILLMWVVWDSLVVPMFHVDSDRRIIDLTLSRAFPVYRGIGCCLLLHWLIGLSMYVWTSARINYRYIFELNPRTTPRVAEMFSDATNMSIVYLVNVLLYYKVVNGYFPEVVHRGYYPLALFVYTFYYYAVRPWRRQFGLVRTLVETVGSPFFPVTFFHIFVGNYLVSLVKVNQDLAWSVCYFATDEYLLVDSVGDLVAPERLCQNNAFYLKVVVPMICALPLWWRFLQNLRRLHDTEKWWPHLPNAFKYALAQVVALFGLFHPFYSTSAAADADGAGGGAFQIVWIALFTLSSLYAWMWDVWMDWGLGRPQYKFLGDRQMFSRKWVYYAAIVADLFLRFAWMVSLIPPSTSHLLPLYLHPLTMVLELFRRTFWSFFTLENEHLRNTQGFRRVDFIPLHYDHGVGDGDDGGLASKAAEPLQGHVFLMKILLIPLLVCGLSVLAITVRK